MEIDQSLIAAYTMGALIIIGFILVLLCVVYTIIALFKSVDTQKSTNQSSHKVNWTNIEETNEKTIVSPPSSNYNKVVVVRKPN